MPIMSLPWKILKKENYDFEMDIRPTDGIGWSDGSMACLVGRGYIGSCENARRTCFLLPEESWEEWQAVHLP